MQAREWGHFVEVRMKVPGKYRIQLSRCELPVGLIQRFLNRAVSCLHVGRLLCTGGVGKRKFLAMSRLLQTRSPPYGGRSGLSWGPSPRAKQVAPDCWLKVRLPGVAGTDAGWGLSLGSLLARCWGPVTPFWVVPLCCFCCQPGEAGTVS